MRQLWLGILLATGAVLASTQSAGDDEYARYDLLDPPSAGIRITHDVSATTSGARTFFMAIPGSGDARDVAVEDRMTGRPLRHDVVSGTAAAEAGQPGAEAGRRYLRVALARPVPAGGESRLRIRMTVGDTSAYRAEGGTLVFEQSLTVARNTLVLPAGHELVGVNMPSQVIEESDGRLAVSSWNTAPAPAPMRLVARRRPAPGPTAQTPPVSSPPVISPGTPAGRPVNELANLRVSERAIQDREIVYFLRQPETHSFRLYHDYTESRPGVAEYRNVVRGGSTVSDPEAVLLDTGEALKVETVREQDAEVVIIRFPAVQPGHSSRLRITETYTDPGRYGLVDGQLVWHRSFGRPANDVVLPEGWYLTDSTIPGVVTTEPDGRTRIAFINPRPDSIDVVLKARRR